MGNALLLAGPLDNGQGKNHNIALLQLLLQNFETSVNILMVHHCLTEVTTLLILCPVLPLGASYQVPTPQQAT